MCNRVERCLQYAADSLLLQSPDTNIVQNVRRQMRKRKHINIMENARTHYESTKTAFISFYEKWKDANAVLKNGLLNESIILQCGVSEWPNKYCSSSKTRVQSPNSQYSKNAKSDWKKIFQNANNKKHNANESFSHPASKYDILQNSDQCTLSIDNANKLYRFAHSKWQQSVQVANTTLHTKNQTWAMSLQDSNKRLQAKTIVPPHNSIPCQLDRITSRAGLTLHPHLILAIWHS